MEPKQIVCLVTLCVFCVSALFILIAFGTPNWFELDVAGYGGNSGLWKSCEFSPTYEKCVSHEFSDMAGFLKTTAGFMILSLLLTIAAGCTYVIMPATAACQIAAGLSAIIAGGVYGSEDITKDHLGYSLALAVTGGVFLFINGIVLAVVAGMNGCSPKPNLPCRAETA